MGMSSLPTTLPSSVELLQLLQEQAALQLLMSVKISVFLVIHEMLHGKREEYMFWCLHPAPAYVRVQYRYNRSCAIDTGIERTCWHVVTLRTNNFLYRLLIHLAGFCHRYQQSMPAHFTQRKEQDPYQRFR